MTNREELLKRLDNKLLAEILYDFCDNEDSCEHCKLKKIRVCVGTNVNNIKEWLEREM